MKNIKLSQPTILIVDDNPKNLEVLGKLLQVEKYKIEFAVNGEAALEWLETRQFDLILLDINMPGMDGFEVCKKIRSNPKLDNLPVIFLSAENERESIFKGFELGAQDYVTKPFDSRELMLRVKTHLLLKKSIEELEELNSSLEEKVKERTHQLNEAKEKAEESDKLKTAFLQNLSHEIRTPMNGILGFSDLLKSPGLSGEEQQEFILLIEQSGQRMLNIINDIVNISKIETGHIELVIKETNVNQLLRHLYTFFLAEAKLKNLNFTYQTSLSDELSKIETDEFKLTQVLTNLINNALKFTKSGSIEFGYSVVGLQNSITRLEFYVQDTGIGIKPEMHDIIFERFRQVEMTAARDYEGAGLGLAISKAFVEKLGGNMWVKSELDKGATFFFDIPYNRQKNGLTEKQKDANYGNRLKHVNILIAEDDDVSLQLLKRMLKFEKANLFFAKNGQETLDIVNTVPQLNIVLMDLKMLEMDGFEATKLIKIMNPLLPVIAQTAYVFSNDKVKAKLAGCDDFVSKPIIHELLIEKILEHVVKT